MLCSNSPDTAPYTYDTLVSSTCADGNVATCRADWSQNTVTSSLSILALVLLIANLPTTISLLAVFAIKKLPGLLRRSKEQGQAKSADPV